MHSVEDWIIQRITRSKYHLPKLMSHFVFFFPPKLWKSKKKRSFLFPTANENSCSPRRGDCRLGSIVLPLQEPPGDQGETRTRTCTQKGKLAWSRSFWFLCVCRSFYWSPVVVLEAGCAPPGGGMVLCLNTGPEGYALLGRWDATLSTWRVLPILNLNFVRSWRHSRPLSD